MNRFRFSLAQSMAIVLLVGVGLAALRSSSVLWSRTVFTLTVGVLSAAILGAMACRGRARMTWAGFALFGWIYLGTTFGPWADVNGVKAPPYVTRWGLDYWDAMRGYGGRIETGPPGEVLFSQVPPIAGKASFDAFQFRRIGHCLAASLFGLVGAALGRLAAAENDRPND
jgi:hypothetical protein